VKQRLDAPAQRSVPKTSSIKVSSASVRRDALKRFGEHGLF
jgi:hypothetical protein